MMLPKRHLSEMPGRCRRGPHPGNSWQEPHRIFCPEMPASRSGCQRSTRSEPGPASQIFFKNRPLAKGGISASEHFFDEKRLLVSLRLSANRSFCSGKTCLPMFYSFYEANCGTTIPAAGMSRQPPGIPAPEPGTHVHEQDTGALEQETPLAQWRHEIALSRTVKEHDV